MKKIIALKPEISIDKALEMTYNDIVKSSNFVGTVTEDGHLRDEISGNIFTYTEYQKDLMRKSSLGKKERDREVTFVNNVPVYFCITVNGRVIRSSSGSAIIPGVIPQPQDTMNESGVKKGSYITDLDLVVEGLGMDLSDSGEDYYHMQDRSDVCYPLYKVKKNPTGTGYQDNVGSFWDIWYACSQLTDCSMKIKTNKSIYTFYWIVYLYVKTSPEPYYDEYIEYKVTEPNGTAIVNVDATKCGQLNFKDTVLVEKDQGSYYVGEDKYLRIIHDLVYCWVKEADVEPKGPEEVECVTYTTTVSTSLVNSSFGPAFPENYKLEAGQDVNVVKRIDRIWDMLGTSYLKVVYNNSFVWVTEHELVKKESSGEKKVRYIVHFPSYIINSEGKFQVDIPAGSKVEVVNPIQTMDHDIFRYVKIIYNDGFMWIRKGHIINAEEGVGYAIWKTNKQTDYFALGFEYQGKYNAGQDVKVVLPIWYDDNLVDERVIMILHNDIAHWIAVADVNEPEGSGEKIEIASWLFGYKGQPEEAGGDIVTYSSANRQKLKDIPGCPGIDWYSYENQSGPNEFVSPYLTGKKFNNHKYGEGELIDENERYWVTLGPKVFIPDYDDEGKLLSEEFGELGHIGRRVDVVLRNTETDKDEEKYVYIECIWSGHIKAHTHNNGVYQTGHPYPKSEAAKREPYKVEYVDGSIVEFTGKEPSTNGNMSDYVVEKLIVYPK